MMDFFKNINGTSKEQKVIQKIVRLAVDQHSKIFIKRNDGVIAAQGLLNSIENKRMIFYLKKDESIENNEVEISFFLSGYVFHLNHKIVPIDNYFYYIPIPDKIKYRRRDVRISLNELLSKKELPPIYAECQENVRDQIGNILDISKNGIGYKPNEIFKDMDLKLNSTIKNIHFILNGKTIILDEVLIRNCHTDLVGIEFIKISNQCKKTISDFIISYLRYKDKMEKEDFIKRNFPNLLKEDSKLLYKKCINKENNQDRPKEEIKKKVLLFDFRDDLLPEVKDEFVIDYHNNPDQARVGLIKNSPQVVISCIYPAKTSTEKLKWLNFINEVKKRKIPLILVIDQIINKDKLIKAVKMFGVQDILIKNGVMSKEQIHKKIYRLAGCISEEKP